MLKKVRLEDAVGLVLAHDVTKVVPGKFKGPLFRRGHIIRQEDLPDFLSIGKEHIYILALEEGEVHEEEAAIYIANAIAGAAIEFGQPKEGRINLKAKSFGLLKIDTHLLKKINSLGEILVATRHENTVCYPGMIVAGTKIVPLYTSGAKLQELDQLCRGKNKLIDIKPFSKKKVGVVITGNEIYKGLIQDKFGEVIKNKIEPLGSVVNYQVIVPDDANLISHAVKEAQTRGSQVIIVCGGLSVDPDDVTVEGVLKSGARVISYGAPVMPGAMFLYAMQGNIPVLGAPAAVSHNPATIFDLVLPRVLADEELKQEDIAELGYGGLCLLCEKCHYPVCPFGK